MSFGNKVPFNVFLKTQKQFRVLSVLEIGISQ